MSINKIKYENKTIAYTVNKARVKNFYIIHDKTSNL